jgi:hypothetical protein
MHRRTVVKSKSGGNRGLYHNILGFSTDSFCRQTTAPGALAFLPKTAGWQADVSRPAETLAQLITM